MTDQDDHPDPAPEGMLRKRDLSTLGWALLGIGLLGIFLFTASYLLTPLIFGLFLYYGTRPIYKRLRQRDLSVLLSASISLLVLGLPVLIITFLITVTAFNEAVVLLEQGNFADLRPLIDQLGIQTADLPEYDSIYEFLTSDGFREVLTGSWGTVSSLTNTVLGVVLSLFLSFTAAFFMYLWGPGAREELIAVFGDDEGLLTRYVRNVDRDLAEVFFGNMLNAVVTSIIGAVAYTGLNLFSPSYTAVPAPILLGLLTGIASFVPMVGSKIVYVPITALLVFQSFTAAEPTGYGFALMFLGIALVIVDMLPDMVLRPLISGRKTSQGALFIGYLIGPLVFGFVGVFLLPLIIVAFINFDRIVLPGFYRPEAGD
jgi:predicted PurR-regulated permease PerM